MKKNNFFILWLTVTLVVPAGISKAEKIKPKSLEGIEFLTGFGWGKIQPHENPRAREDYHLHPFIVDFNFNLKPLTQKFNFNPGTILQFQIEPFISLVSQPDANLETGTSFLFKFGVFPQDAKFQPYAKAGVGMVYMTQHNQEQGAQFNFIDHGGIGMHYFFRKNTAFTLEARFRHLSNSGIERPNHGINTYFVITGVTYKF